MYIRKTWHYNINCFDSANTLKLFSNSNSLLSDTFLKFIFILKLMKMFSFSETMQSSCFIHFLVKEKCCQKLSSRFGIFKGISRCDSTGKEKTFGSETVITYNSNYNLFIKFFFFLNWLQIILIIISASFMLLCLKLRHKMHQKLSHCWE